MLSFPQGLTPGSKMWAFNRRRRGGGGGGSGGLKGLGFVVGLEWQLGLQPETDPQTGNRQYRVGGLTSFLLRGQKKKKQQLDGPVTPGPLLRSSKNWHATSWTKVGGHRPAPEVDDWSRDVGTAGSALRWLRLAHILDPFCHSSSACHRRCVIMLTSESYCSQKQGLKYFKEGDFATYFMDSKTSQQQ